MDIAKVFVDFMTDRGYFNNYIDELLKQKPHLRGMQVKDILKYLKENLNYKQFSSDKWIIVNSFIWGHSTVGSSYWSSVSRDWEGHLAKIEHHKQTETKENILIKGETKCLHKNKSRKVFQTFSYDYCPDCKQEC